MSRVRARMKLVLRLDALPAATGPTDPAGEAVTAILPRNAKPAAVHRKALAYADVSMRHWRYDPRQQPGGMGSTSAALEFIALTACQVLRGDGRAVD